MRKHIFGFAIFALIVGSAIFVYQLFYPVIEPQINRRAPEKRSAETYPIIKPGELATDIYAATPASVVVDVNSKKLYAGIDDKGLDTLMKNEFVKVIVFAENSDEIAFETGWLKYINTSNVVFRCDACASMTSNKNYYARLYFAAAPDDANLHLRLENEKSGEYYLQSTAVLVNSGKNK